MRSWCRPSRGSGRRHSRAATVRSEAPRETTPSHGRDDTTELPPSIPATFKEGRLNHSLPSIAKKAEKGDTVLNSSNLDDRAWRARQLSGGRNAATRSSVAHFVRRGRGGVSSFGSDDGEQTGL